MSEDKSEISDHDVVKDLEDALDRSGDVNTSDDEDHLPKLVVKVSEGDMKLSNDLKGSGLMESTRTKCEEDHVGILLLRQSSLI